MATKDWLFASNHLASEKMDNVFIKVIKAITKEQAIEKFILQDDAGVITGLIMLYDNAYSFDDLKIDNGIKALNKEINDSDLPSIDPDDDKTQLFLRNNKHIIGTILGEDTNYIRITELRYDEYM
jgi:hypothetical protein